MSTNGHQVSKAKRVRIVPNIKIENMASEGVVMMMLGDRHPELASAMRPKQARELADALIKHAEALEREAPRIILPGTDLAI